MVLMKRILSTVVLFVLLVLTVVALTQFDRESTSAFNPSNAASHAAH